MPAWRAKARTALDADCAGMLKLRVCAWAMAGMAIAVATAATETTDRWK